MTNIDTTDNMQTDGTATDKVTINIWDKNSNGKEDKERNFDNNKSRLECFWKPDKSFRAGIKRKVFNQHVLPAMT